jgi:voltage-gated potassium channel Kch
MNPNLFSLAWRETIRSAYWGKSLATNIGLGFLALYFSLSFLLLGFAVPEMLTKDFPDVDPVSKFNSILLAYLAIDLIIRQLMQKLPTVSFKPLLLLNIRRPKIANYLLVRSVLNFFNVLPFFLLVPVTIKLVAETHSGMATAAWFLSLFILIFSNHFLAIYLKWRFNEAEYGFFIFLGVLAGLFAINHFGIVDLSGGLGKLLDLILVNPVIFIVLISLPVLLYFLNVRFLLSRMFINMLSGKQKEEKIRDYSWLDRLGENGRFIALELKLIWRNKRPRSVAMMSVIILFYGLLIYRAQPGHEIPGFAFVLGGIIMVGMFSISYGQFFPAWHSNYFSMLMCQRLTMKQFLRSFYMLVTVVSVICYLLTLPYAFMFPKILYTHLAMLFYNLGVNIPIMFWVGMYSKKRLDLNQSSVMNYQGVSASQWLGAFPLMIGPITLYYLFKLAIGETGSYVALGSIGFIGILFHSAIIDFFSKQYRKQKHQLIKNYKNS